MFIVIGADLLLIKGTECMPNDRTRCRDVIKGLTYLHKSLPLQMLLDDRCKRYAVLLSLADIQGTPYRVTVAQVASLHGQIIDTLYRLIPGSRQISLYTGAINRYKASKLEPPFVDLISCLRQIAPLASGDHFNEELDLILDLYKRILDQPDFEIELDSIDLSRFDPSFKKTLAILFEENLGGRTGAGIYVDPNDDDPLSAWHSEINSEQQEIEKERKRYLNRLNQKRYREKNLEELLKKDRARKQQLAEQFLKRFAEGLPIGAADSDVGDTNVESPGGSTLPSPSSIQVHVDQEKQQHAAERRRHLRNERQRRFRERHKQRLKEKDRERRRQLRSQLEQLRAAGIDAPRKTLIKRTPYIPVDLLEKQAQDRVERNRRLARQRAVRFRERNRDRLNQKQRDWRRKNKELRERLEQQDRLLQEEQSPGHVELEGIVLYHPPGHSNSVDSGSHYQTSEQSQSLSPKD